VVIKVEGLALAFEKSNVVVAHCGDPFGFDGDGHSVFESNTIFHSLGCPKEEGLREQAGYITNQEASQFIIGTVFALNLTLSVSFGETVSHKGDSPMNEWLNDELAGFEKQDNEKRAQAERQNLIQQHAYRVFQDIKLLMENAVQQMRTSVEFKKRVGDLEGQFMYVDKVVVKKLMYPAVYLTVSCGPNSIDIHRTLVTNGADRQSWEERESLQVELDNDGNPFLRNKEGVSLVIEQAVRYIFHPILHPETIDQKRRESGSWSVSSW